MKEGFEFFTIFCLGGRVPSELVFSSSSHVQNWLLISFCFSLTTTRVPYRDSLWRSMWRPSSAFRTQSGAEKWNYGEGKNTFRQGDDGGGRYVWKAEDKIRPTKQNNRILAELLTSHDKRAEIFRHSIASDSLRRDRMEIREAFEAIPFRMNFVWEAILNICEWAAYQTAHNTLAREIWILVRHTSLKHHEQNEDFSNRARKIDTTTSSIGARMSETGKYKKKNFKIFSENSRLMLAS